MFCVDCGEEKQIFRDGSCLECYLKNHQFSKGPKVIDIPVCVHCGSLKYKSLWSKDALEHVIERYVKQIFTIHAELEQISIHVSCEEEVERYCCSIVISGTIDHTPITESHSLFIRLKQQSCDVCSKQFGGYHEAILQIRPNKKSTAHEIVQIRQFIEGFIVTLQEQGHRTLFIADVEETHGGIDFYLSDKQAGSTIAKKVQEKYGGVITTSSKNTGMKDGKQLYRVTYLLRLPPYRQNDFVKYNGEYFYILSISQHNVSLINLATWEKRSLAHKDLENVHIIGGKELIKDMVFINQYDNEIQVMEPNTYNLMILRKPRFYSYHSDKIHIVAVDPNTVFLFPPE
jgi:nonsense-mediated mRNA decay protein 3